MKWKVTTIPSSDRTALVHVVKDQDGKTIAYRGFIDNGKRQESLRLIAAAPEMLETLENVWKDCASNFEEPYPPSIPTMLMVKKTIDKAKGRNDHDDTK